MMGDTFLGKIRRSFLGRIRGRRRNRRRRVLPQIRRDSGCSLWYSANTSFGDMKSRQTFGIVLEKRLYLFMLVIGGVTGRFTGLAAQMVCRSLRGRWKHGAWNRERSALRIEQSGKRPHLQRARPGIRISQIPGLFAAIGGLPLQEFLHTGDLSPASSGAAFLGSRRSMEVSA